MIDDADEMNRNIEHRDTESDSSTTQQRGGDAEVEVKIIIFSSQQHCHQSDDNEGDEKQCRILIDDHFIYVDFKSLILIILFFEGKSQATEMTKNAIELQAIA